MNNKNEYIGVLATDDEIGRANGDYNKKAVFINNNSELQFSIKIISKTKVATEFNDNKIILCTCYFNKINDICNFVDNINMNWDDRVKDFREFLSRYLFIMSYHIEQKINGTFVMADVYKLVKKPSTYRENVHYITVPTFSSIQSTREFEAYNNSNENTLSKKYNNLNDFSKCLQSRRAIGKIIGFPELEENQPRIIFWKGINEEILALGPMPKCTYVLEGLSFQSAQMEDIKCVEFKDGEYDSYVCDIKGNPTLLHISEDYYTVLLESLEKAGISLNEFVQMKTVELDVSNNLTEDVFIEDKTNDDVEEDNHQDKEAKLIERLEYIAQRKNIYYDRKDLINFHTAIKTGSLVILSGMSGTGKSKLVTYYAQALGLHEDEGECLIIPVRPNWNDDSDLLGHVDLIHMVYRPSDTGFCKLLVDAAKDKQTEKRKLYLVCFDEMNLSRVEYYFSQFLSILEKDEDKRKLRLYDAALAGKLYNSVEYPDVIEIGNNIMFVGTVNIDESTYHFSDKVLDRANVIKLSVLDFNKWENKEFGVVSSDPWTALDFKNIKEADDSRFTETHKAFLWEFHNMLHNVSANLGIGPRIVKQIAVYLNNVPMLNDEIGITLDEAFDIQIVQRILTKIKGSEEQYGDFLGCSLGDTPDIFKLLDKYHTLSEFKKTRESLGQKKKELKLYGYCL